MDNFEASQYHIQELFAHIQGLAEDTDQSREQVCSPIADEPLPSNVMASSRSHLKATMITEKLSESIVKGEEKSMEEPFRQELERLRKVNRKLFEDNKALMKECVRLKKINKQFLEGEKARQLELQNLHYMTEINKLRTENIHLRGEFYAVNKGESESFPALIHKEFDHLNQQYENIKQRLNQISSSNRKNSGIESTEEQSNRQMKMPNLPPFKKSTRKKQGENEGRTKPNHSPMKSKYISTIKR